MMSCYIDPKLTPPPPSVTLKWLFYLHLHTECHKITYPPPFTWVTSFMNGPLVNIQKNTQSFNNGPLNFEYL